MTESSTQGEMTITRTFDAPREEVYRSWTDPTYFTHWFGAPLPKISMDVRPGGSFSAIMVYEDQEIPFAGAYREVVEPERLVFTLVDTKSGDESPEELVTVTFADLGGKTEMVFHQSGHLPEAQVAEAKEGWSMMFDGIAEHLAKL